MFNTQFSHTTQHDSGTLSAGTALNFTAYTTLTAAGVSVPNSGNYYSFIVWGTFIPAETGTYTFTCESDDASDLVINNTTVASFYGGRGTPSLGTTTGTISLTANTVYTFIARMQEFAGGDGLRVYWKRPSESLGSTWYQHTSEIGAGSGEIGIAGAQGNAGNKGIKGDLGLKGQKGAIGAVGNKGDVGLVGVKGQKGITGDAGNKGLKGNTGDIGVKGITGNAGNKGIKGDFGQKGQKGSAGDAGNKGSIGLLGVKGQKGIRGNAGNKGVLGDKGHKGIKGITGAAGNKGIKGNFGVKGIKGIKGNTGNKGIKGGGGAKGNQMPGGGYFEVTPNGLLTFKQNGWSSGDPIYIIRTFDSGSL